MPQDSWRSRIHMRDAAQAERFYAWLVKDGAHHTTIDGRIAYSILPQRNLNNLFYHFERLPEEIEHTKKAYQK